MSNDAQAHTVISLDLHKLEMDIATALPSIRAGSVQIGPMLDYVEHQDGVGALSAEAMVGEYEAAAKEIVAMGAELIGAAKQCEAMTAEARNAIAYMRETATAYREQGKTAFKRIEDGSALIEEVRQSCRALKQKTGSSAPT
jgi:hypothetical protein